MCIIPKKGIERESMYVYIYIEHAHIGEFVFVYDDNVYISLFLCQAYFRKSFDIVVSMFLKA